MWCRMYNQNHHFVNTPYKYMYTHYNAQKQCSCITTQFYKDLISYSYYRCKKVLSESRGLTMHVYSCPWSGRNFLATVINYFLDLHFPDLALKRFNFLVPFSQLPSQFSYLLILLWWFRLPFKFVYITITCMYIFVILYVHEILYLPADKLLDW